MIMSSCRKCNNIKQDVEWNYNLNMSYIKLYYLEFIKKMYTEIFK